MANRDPEPESAHQQFSDDYLEKQKALQEAAEPPVVDAPKSLLDILTDISTPWPVDPLLTVEKKEGEKGGKK